jgi:ribosomal protein L29
MDENDKNTKNNARAMQADKLNTADVENTENNAKTLQAADKLNNITAENNEALEKLASDLRAFIIKINKNTATSERVLQALEGAVKPLLDSMSDINDKMELIENKTKLFEEMMSKAVDSVNTDDIKTRLRDIIFTKIKTANIILTLVLSIAIGATAGYFSINLYFQNKSGSMKNGHLLSKELIKNHVPVKIIKSGKSLYFLFPKKKVKTYQSKNGKFSVVKIKK